MGGAVAITADLTDMQVSFIKQLARGTPQGEAARIAGYAGPDQQAWHLLRMPHIMEAVRKERDRIIGGELAGVALGVIRTILSDPGPPTKLKLDAAKFTLTLAGHGVPASSGGPGDGLIPGKPMHEMTRPELDAYAARARAWLDQYQPPIDVTPGSAPEPGTTAIEAQVQQGKSTPLPGERPKLKGRPKAKRSRSKPKA